MNFLNLQKELNDASKSIDQINEIENANLKPGEEDELCAERKRMMNSEKIYACLNEVDENLSNGVIDGINASVRALEKIEDIDEEYKEKLNLLKIQP